MTDAIKTFKSSVHATNRGCLEKYCSSVTTTDSAAERRKIETYCVAMKRTTFEINNNNLKMSRFFFYHRQGIVRFTMKQSPCIYMCLFLGYIHKLYYIVSSHVRQSEGSYVGWRAWVNALYIWVGIRHI